LIALSILSVAYSHWADTVDVTGTVTTLQRKNTNLDFSLTPNPAYVGQTVTMLGNLTDELNHPINDTAVEIFVNGKFVGSLFTNSSGWFTASAKVYTAGTFIVKVVFDGSEIYKPSNHIETLTVQKMNTKVSFTLSPNPAKAGQTITMLGNLTDINNNLIGNAPLEVYVKTYTGPWQYMGTIFTNSSGWFKASAPAPSVGTYTVRVECAGSPQYHPSFDERVLVVETGLSIAIYTDKYTYHVGDTMHLGLNVSNAGKTITVDFKIWIVLPSGGNYTYLDMPSVTIPAGLSYSNSNFKMITLPSIPTGTYRWHAAFIDPSTHKIIVEDTAEWQFS